jgi:hypothetical protein
MMARISFTIGFVLAFGVSVASANNLIANGDFETAPFNPSPNAVITGWTNSGDTRYGQVFNGTYWGISPHGGSYQALLGGLGALEFLSQDVATTPSGSYELSFWLANVFSSTSTAQVKIGGTTVWQENNQGVFPYTPYTFDFTATSATTNIEFGFRQDDTYFLLDDVSVASVPEPGTLTLLGSAVLGLAGVVYLRRRRARV